MRPIPDIMLGDLYNTKAPNTSTTIPQIEYEAETQESRKNEGRHSNNDGGNIPSNGEGVLAQDTTTTILKDRIDVDMEGGVVWITAYEHPDAPRLGIPLKQFPSSCQELQGMDQKIEIASILEFSDDFEKYVKLYVPAAKESVEMYEEEVKLQAQIAEEHRAVEDAKKKKEEQLQFIKSFSKNFEKHVTKGIQKTKSGSESRRKNIDKLKEALRKAQEDRRVEELATTTYSSHLKHIKGEKALTDGWFFKREDSTS